MKNIIDCTNRALVFEEINANKLNLLTLLGDVEEGVINDSTIESINKHLLVTSFDEFLLKFEPRMYSFFDVNTQQIQYVLKKPENLNEELITEIDLGKNNHFVKMLISLIESRKVNGTKNIDFKFEDILSLLSPAKIIEDIKQNRKEIQYLYDRYEKLDDMNPEKRDIGSKLNTKFSMISKHYNNTLTMLPLAIEDIKTKLLINNQERTQNIEDIKAGVLELSDNGDLKVIEYKSEISKELVPLTEKTNQLELIYRQDYQEVSKTPNQYIEDLVVRTFIPLQKQYEKINVEEEVIKYNNYLEFYKHSQEQFIKTAKPLIETIISVKTFFDQYDVKNKKMQPALLITNVSNTLWNLDTNIKRLSEYLKHVNNKNDLSNSIWFGIYPNIDLDESEVTTKNIFKTNVKKESKGNDLTTLITVASLMSKYKIQVFFNFALNEKMTFENMSIAKIDYLKEKLRNYIDKEYSEYLIPVIPNFTIIPKAQSGVVLDKRITVEDNKIKYNNKEDEIKFWIDGVYISSSYVAAGLVCAYQCPQYMKERYSNVLSDTPSVRFNIESEDNYIIVKTTLSREISGYTVDFKNMINADNFGFIFSSDMLQYKGNRINNITVYKARCLLRDSDGYFEPIFKTLTSTYISRVIRNMTADFKLDKLNFFFSNTPSSQKSIWLKNAQYINSVISEGDGIEHEVDETTNRFKLMLKFSRNEKNLTFEMNKNE